MAPEQEERSVVAVYDTHAAAEAGLRAVHRAGVDMTKLSIVGKGFHTEEHALGFYSVGDRVKLWAGRGASWGALWGLLIGYALFFIPALGPIVVMGPLVGWIAGVVEGAAVGGTLGALAAGLASIGLPRESVVKYELEVKAGRFLVLAHGSAALAERVRKVLLATGAALVDEHDHRGVAPSRVLITACPEAGAEEERAEKVMRQDILTLLSDEEVARVSTVESASQLDEGEEYLDLEQLDQGVRRHVRSSAFTGRMVPRRAVAPATWTAILARLAAPAAAPQLGA